jgi:NAD(P)H-hydrate epimerase
MKLVSAAEMTELDERAQSEFGIPSIVLMESAGKAAWDHMRDRVLGSPGNQRLVFVAGPGNNGGDALVMARYCALEARHRCLIVLARSSLKKDAERQRLMVEAMGVPVVSWQDQEGAVAEALGEADWIVDGLSGTGLSGPLRSPHVDIARLVNQSHARTLSIDSPSGIGDGTRPAFETVQADVTLTLGLPKRCLFAPGLRARCGVIRVVPFTLPSQLVLSAGSADELLEDGDLGRVVFPLAADAHKGERGLVSVFAGSVGTTGAAALCSQACLAAGAGLVTTYASPEVYETLAAQLRSVMVRPESDWPPPDGRSNRRGAVLVGPGWGGSAEREEQLVGLLSAFERGVVDADGLTVLSRLEPRPSLEGWVLTPHPGELARLTGMSVDAVRDDPFGAARRAAEQYNAVVVSKSVTTLITRGDGRVSVVDGSNPALATAGSGDVLAGVIAAQLARGADGWDAARVGALAHAVAGRELAASAGLFLSSELPAAVGRVLGRVLLPGTHHGA